MSGIWQLVLSAMLIGAPVLSRGQAHRIVAARTGLVEAGVPSFAVLGAESLGLDSPPTDIRLMPDGRILVVAAQQLAIGDGVRWEVFREAPSETAAHGSGSIVDRDGNIYLGVQGGGARVVFGEDRLWRLPGATATGRDEALTRSVPQYVVETGNGWFWYSSSGAVISWRPGEMAKIVGQMDTVERIFEFDGNTYLSDRPDGRLSRITNGKQTTIMAEGTLSAITCGQPYGSNLLLVGTYGLGLRLFDGLSARPFPSPRLLSKGTRINDLCTTEGGLYAAAVDNYGVVFFDHDGHVVQVLDRSLDHRLSGVKRLIPATGGVIWGLLDGGVLRIGFPSPVSNFEPYIGTGITTVHPYRLDGRLWLIADGKIYQGKYDADGRLARVEVDTPSESFVSNLSVALGFPVVGTEQGAFHRDASGWVPITPSINNLRILDPRESDGRWLYGAHNEIGWLKQKVPDEGVELVTRIAVPELPRVYNSVPDSRGYAWLEIGSGRIGLIRFQQGQPQLEILSGEAGVPQNWAQIFSIDGVVRFNFAERFFRFDEASHRLVPDDNFERSLPGFDGSVIGRPGLDSQGRLWVSANGAVHVLEKEGGMWRERAPPIDVGFLPYYFTFQSDGVVWMHALHRLARYDPRMPLAQVVPLRALISHVDLVANNRSIFGVGHELPPLAYTENSFVAHFGVSGNPFASPVTFDVQLEGLDKDWISAGSSGAAAFNRLKEGDYVLHVRPRAGNTIGAEAKVAFAIRPPWYRTPIAYVAYGISALGTVLITAWLLTFLQRREKSRLERLVAQRTSELSQSNKQLETQVEEIRVLTGAIVQSPIAVFITKPDGVIEFSNPRSAELTGYAADKLDGLNLHELRSSAIDPQTREEICSALLRSESWSGQLAYRHRDGHFVHVRSSISPILSQDGEARHHLVLEEDISEWLDDQERHRKLQAQLTQAQKTESIGRLAGGIAHDFNNILTGILGYCELARMAADAKTDVKPDLQQIRAAGLRAKELVAQILAFSRQSSSKLVPLDLAGPVSEAIKLIRASTPATIEIVEKIETGIVVADPTHVHQAVINLCTNAIHAMSDRHGKLRIAVENVAIDASYAAEVPNLKPGLFVRLSVSDNGHGMDESTLERIFDPFFTTKAQGEGTGLGLAIVQGVVVSHRGALNVKSKPGEGTTFELYFPHSDQPVAVTKHASRPSAGEGQEILLIDDEVAVVEFAASRLRHFGYRPIAFRDPREALAAFNADPARFAALVTDLTMPHLTGLDLIERVRAKRPFLPVLVLTGYGRETTREKLAALPCCILLHKPFGGDDLAQALGEVMDLSRRASAAKV